MLNLDRNVAPTVLGLWLGRSTLGGVEVRSPKVAPELGSVRATDADDRVPSLACHRSARAWRASYAPRRSTTGEAFDGVEPREPAHYAG